MIAHFIATPSSKKPRRQHRIRSVIQERGKILLANKQFICHNRIRHSVSMLKKRTGQRNGVG